MAITITANLDASGVKVGAKEASAALDGMATQAESSNDKLDQVAKELFGDLGALKERTAALKDELSRMADSGEQSLSEVSGAAEGAGESLKKVGDGASQSRDKIKTIAVAYLAVADVAKKVVELGKKVGEAIAWAAENGNPAAIELQESFKEVQSAMLEIAEDPVFQDMLGGLADTIREDVIPALKAIPDAWVLVQDSYADGLVVIGEGLGLFAEGTREVLGEMQAMEEKSRKSRQETRKATKQQEEDKKELDKVEVGLAKLQAARDADATQAALGQIETEGELQDVIEDMTEALRKRSKEEKLSDEDRQAAIGKIVQAEQRLKQVRANAASESAKLAAESVKLAADSAAERERIAKEEADTKEKLAKESLDQDRKNIDERKRLLSGSDVKGAESLIGSQSRDQVRTAFANRQGMEAAASADSSGGSQKDIAAARQKAVALAKRQFDTGKADGEDVRKVQVDMANETVQNAEKLGTVSRDTASALRESVSEMARMQGDTERLRAEVDSVTKMQQAVILQGQRKRSQVSGAGR